MVLSQDGLAKVGHQLAAMEPGDHVFVVPDVAADVRRAPPCTDRPRTAP